MDPGEGGTGDAAQLQEWITILTLFDFSTARVKLVMSLPEAVGAYATTDFPDIGQAVEFTSTIQAPIPAVLAKLQPPGEKRPVGGKGKARGRMTFIPPSIGHSTPRLSLSYGGAVLGSLHREVTAMLAPLLEAGLFSLEKGDDGGGGGSGSGSGKESGPSSTGVRSSSSSLSLSSSSSPS
jgi:hypothetical protein